eukprot:m.115053 g.115053  ORF g.115053 m.115053 type:complete len:219 (-) comp13552_c0_seq4:1865-2521(-)
MGEQATTDACPTPAGTGAVPASTLRATSFNSTQPEKPQFTCSVCNAKVRTKQGLHTHMTVKHGISQPVPKKKRQRKARLKASARFPNLKEDALLSCTREMLGLLCPPSWAGGATAMSTLQTVDLASFPIQDFVAEVTRSNQQFQDGVQEAAVKRASTIQTRVEELGKQELQCYEIAAELECVGLLPEPDMAQLDRVWREAAVLLGLPASEHDLPRITE